MDHTEYARRCAQPSVMRRGELRATVARLREAHTVARLREAHPALAVQVERVLDAPPVPKPAEHRGGTEADFLELDLADGVIEAVADALGDLESSLVQEEAAPPDVLSAATDLHARWRAAESSRPDAA